MGTSTTAEVKVTPDGASGFLGAITIPRYDLTIPFTAEVERRPAAEGGTPELHLKDFKIGAQPDQLGKGVHETFRRLALAEMGVACGTAPDANPTPSDNTYTVPVGRDLKNFLQASEHPLLQALYYSFHAAERWVRDSLFGRRGATSTDAAPTPSPEVSARSPAGHDPELVVCELLCGSDPSKSEITVKQVPSDGAAQIEVEKDHRHLLTWAIGTYHDKHLDRFDSLSKERHLKPFRDLTIRSDRGLEKAKWYGPVLNAHLSRFTVGATSCELERHVVELVMSKDTVFSVDQSGDHSQLVAIKDDLFRGSVPYFNMNSVGALAGYLIERTLRSNDQVLDGLDKVITRLEEKVKVEHLPAEAMTNQIPALQQSLRYYARKLGQNTEVFNALKRAPEIQPTMFGGKNPDFVLNPAEQSLRSLLERAKDLLARVESVERQHESRRKERTDRNIELLTIPVGAGVPPILAEIACRTIFKHAEGIHDPMIIASFVVGAAMVGLALATDFKPLQLLHGVRSK